MTPIPNTGFFRSGPEGRTDGGLFSLDGVHPTTIGYGVIARELIRIMSAHAGVPFFTQDGAVPGARVRPRGFRARDRVGQPPEPAAASALVDSRTDRMARRDRRLGPSRPPIPLRWFTVSRRSPGQLTWGFTHKRWLRGGRGGRTRTLRQAVAAGAKDGAWSRDQCRWPQSPSVQPRRVTGYA
jgi:hypothetical protein